MRSTVAATAACTRACRLAGSITSTTGPRPRTTKHAPSSSSNCTRSVTHASGSRRPSVGPGCTRHHTLRLSAARGSRRSVATYCCLRRNCSVDACQYALEIKVGGPFEARLEDGRFLDSRYAVGAKSPGRVRNKIPGGALGDETERVNRSFHTLAAGLTIADHQGAIARYGVLNEWQRAAQRFDEIDTAFGRRMNRGRISGLFRTGSDMRSIIGKPVGLRVPVRRAGNRAAAVFTTGADLLASGPTGVACSTLGVL